LKQLKCVVYGIEADKFNDFWISTNANPLVCVLSLWRIEWVKGASHLLQTQKDLKCFSIMTRQKFWTSYRGGMVASAIQSPNLR
ncbi:hypothetical protein HID58_044030, partial [Brassica napus]